jgi:glycosyltransferase involved in cell wall biosynthesis
MSSVGLVHDYLLVLRGAERTFAAIADVWPDAPVYTLLYDEDATHQRFVGHEIHTSPLQKTGVRQRGFRRLLPMFPWATGRLPIGDHDVVVSSSSAFAIGAPVPERSIHVCYCHTPFRYAWFESGRGLGEVPRAVRPAYRAVMHRVRRWDLRAASRVTSFIANSLTTQRRIADIYGRDSTVIHPPVDVDRFSIGEPEDYFLFVGELVRHKRVEVALEAAQKAGKQIKIVGSGPDYLRLQEQYAGTAEFMRRLPDEQLSRLYSGALALVVPNVEEFGIAAVEIQAAGRPVLGVDAGGLRETVVPGTTGVLVSLDKRDELADAMANVDFRKFDSKRIAEHARQFSREAFQGRIKAEVEAVRASRP